MPDLLTMLDQLHDLYTRQEALRQAQEAAVPPALRKLLTKLEARFGPQRQILERDAEHLVADLKAAVLQHGASVKGKALHAIVVSGKPSWSDQALQGYAAGHPEILPFRTLGKPAVSIRTATGSDHGASD